jgi:type I restriction enzyme R subunit
MQELFNAQNSDLFDILKFVKHALKPVTRKTRAIVSRYFMEVGIGAKRLEFFDFLVSHYIESGMGELEESKSEIFLRLSTPMSLMQ